MLGRNLFLFQQGTAEKKKAVVRLEGLDNSYCMLTQFGSSKVFMYDLGRETRDKFRDVLTN